ncbi:DUF1753-domain-containing protein [Acaromyces ingoldii]|uniref:DUF1753-domain-containing protein n=1 Tax=Acaromyces ingoldii TaxID=215250 RepID=A0A316YN88_9BASI|nr:DUF1753-domain-containing protein [Acaromyces ingoldii]PWN90612.1 DUF1753-domain-containing protein [Acaromyces ingoldii]
MTRLWFRAPAVQAHLTSFLGVMDLKLGVTLITLFALFNKVAGVYGILSLFQGGSFAQVSMYLYSIATIGLFLWAMPGISDEDPIRTLRYAHLFMADHLLSSAWTLLFGLWWFLYVPHNGDRPVLAPHQAGLMDLIESIEKSYEAPGKQLHHEPLAGQERVEAAQRVWREERGFSFAVLASGWLLKVYFALVIYSYALHLRHGTYRKLPLSKPTGSSANGSQYRPLRSSSFDVARDDEEELPAWSDDEEDRLSGAKKIRRGARTDEAAAKEAETSATAGDQLARPPSSLERRGSALNEASPSSSNNNSSMV